jgi:bifunctional DNA-binding transcriptional regulator/antitoxin component of YhaV-PrlF toxin-antitoxin module
MKKVKERRRGATRISAKNQVTIPVDALREAGLASGDFLVARCDGPGRIVLERRLDLIEEFSGALTGIYRPDEVERLRSEWD